MNLAELWIKFYWVCVHWAISIIILRKALVPRDQQYNKPLLYLRTTEPLFYVFDGALSNYTEEREIFN